MSTSKSPRKPSPQRLRALERRQRLERQQAQPAPEPTIMPAWAGGLSYCSVCNTWYPVGMFHYHSQTWPSSITTWVNNVGGGHFH